MEQLLSPLHGPVTDAVIAAHPNAKLELDGPTHGGYWWMDITIGERWIVVEWRPEGSFGVSRNDNREVGYGEGHEHRLTDQESAIAKILELLHP